MAWVGLSLMLEDDWRQAAYPLLAEGLVDVLEWTLELSWQGPSGRNEPPWASALLDHYAREGRLFGHAVDLSPFTAGAGPRRRRWIEQARPWLARRRVRHLTEHVGFAAAPGFFRGPPLPLPDSPAVRATAQAGLTALAEAAPPGTVVGLENLALGFSRRDALDQGRLLSALLAPWDGVLLLDLHNLWCQMVNLDLSAEALLADYPLRRVRQIHVAGGSWWPVEGTARWRRDTHDHAIPGEVLELLRAVLPRCPRCEAVIFERMPIGLSDAEGRARFQADFRAVRAVVEEVGGAQPSEGLPRGIAAPHPDEVVPRQQAELMRFQAEMMAALWDSPELSVVAPRLAPLAAPLGFADWVSGWSPAAVALGHALMRQWGRRAGPRSEAPQVVTGGRGA